MSSSFKSVNSYLIKETFVSFLVAFAFFFFIFFVNQILLIAEQILSKRVPLGDVMLLMVFYLPQIVSYAFPFSALVGSLMAVGRLSSDNEILAFRASGLSLIKIFSPILFLSFALFTFSFLFNDIFLPLGYINSQTFYKHIMKTNPGLELEPYMAKNFENKIIITGDVQGNELFDIIIIDTMSDKEKRVINADNAFLLENTEQEGVISLELHNVFSHTVNTRTKGEYDYLHAEKMIYNILLKQFMQNIESRPGPKDMSALDLHNKIEGMRDKLQDRIDGQMRKVGTIEYKLQMEIQYAAALGSKNISRLNERNSSIANIYRDLQREKKVKIEDKLLKLYELEFYRKFSAPFSCVVFIVFAFPVALVARRSGRLVGFAIGVIMSGVYWGLLFVAYRTGARMDIHPFVTVWIPNFVILGLGIIIFAMRLRR